MSGPIYVQDQFHFSHFYYYDDQHDGVSMTSVSEDEEDDYSDVYSSDDDTNNNNNKVQKQRSNEEHHDLKLQFIQNVLGDDNIHFGKWPSQSHKQQQHHNCLNSNDPDSYSKATELMTSHMFALAEQMQPHKKTTLNYIDLGSGTASAALQIVSECNLRNKHNTSATDSSSSSIQGQLHVHATCLNLCRKQNQKANLAVQQRRLTDQIKIVTGNFEQPMPFHQDSFDVVFSQDALLHAFNKSNVYQQALRICRPGGALVICDLVAGPSSSSSSDDDDACCEHSRFSATHRLRDWQTAATAVRQLQEAGWVHVQVEDLTADLMTSFQAMKLKVQYALMTMIDNNKSNSNSSTTNNNNVLERALLQGYVQQIDERIDQIQSGLLGWSLFTARKPVRVQLGIPKLPMPMKETTNLEMIAMPGKNCRDHRSSSMITNNPSAVVTDILHPVTADTVRDWPDSVEALVTLSAGLDHIDIPACEAKGVTVYQAGRHAITHHVAEYVAAFCVLGLRQALPQNGVPFPQKGSWNLNWNVQGMPLGKATIAIVGMGLIAQELVGRLRALQESELSSSSPASSTTTTILYHVPREFRDAKAEAKYNLVYCDDLKDMAKRCDLLVPMCPLNKFTKNIINADILEALGPQAGLINMSRGSVVDTEDLTDALRDESIAYAILDTTHPEPLPADHELWHQSNCHIYPHYATNTPAVRQALVDDIETVMVQHFGLDFKLESSDASSSDIDNSVPSEKQLRHDLAVAHRLTAQYGMDMTVWNHISARIINSNNNKSDDGNSILITPGRMLWSQVSPDDLLVSSTNVTADIIHAAVYAARHDVQAVIHLHTPNAVAISCLEQGFVPISQDAAYFYEKVAVYDWDGLSTEDSEGPAIQDAIRSVPGCNTLLMKNHGFCCFGQSVKEAWTLAYYFERACEVQLKVLQCGAKVSLPRPAVMRQAAEVSYLPEFAPGVCEWEALCKTVSFDDDDDDATE